MGGGSALVVKSNERSRIWQTPERLMSEKGGIWVKCPMTLPMLG